MIRSLFHRFWALALVSAALRIFSVPAQGAIHDIPFLQDSSQKFTISPELAGAGFKKLVVDEDNRVLVLTERGVARLFPSEGTVAPDRTYRPLIGVVPHDLTSSGGIPFYLLNDQLISNGNGGRDALALDANTYQLAAVGADNSVLLSGPKGALLYTSGASFPFANPTNTILRKLYVNVRQFYALCNDGLYVLKDRRFHRLVNSPGITAVGFKGAEIIIGTLKGYYTVNSSTGQIVRRPKTRLPVLEINCIQVATNGVWFGTPKGAFLEETNGEIRYYASQRWLREDNVVDIALDNAGGVYVLGLSSLSQIRFDSTTLAQKAAYFDQRVRDRHIRYGFCAEVRLARPGDVTSDQMIDTDNDGCWSEYYLCSQAFRYAATGDEKARANAWETFAAIERLMELTGVPGLPARSIERSGFRVSDPDAWRPSPTKGWDWKTTTSSDEITAHWFGCAVMLECVAKTPAERQRVQRFLDSLTGNIVKNDFQLLDWNGKPTHWGRWDPTYVNGYPPSVFDRRLNSQEIIAGLELTLNVTGNNYYRDRLNYLTIQGSYLENIHTSMTNLKVTNYPYDGDNMGDVWNHSDDLLAFDSYWVLTRSAISPEMRRVGVAALRDHFLMERNERCPLWNFIYASTGATDADVENGMWTLRRFPMDMITWRIENSHRHDITRLPPNFRQQEMAELLPPGERQITRWSSHPFVLDGGDGGATELAGDEFLLPYWMARYLKLIE